MHYLFRKVVIPVIANIVIFSSFTLACSKADIINEISIEASNSGKDYANYCLKKVNDLSESNLISIFPEVHNKKMIRAMLLAKLLQMKSQYSDIEISKDNSSVEYFDHNDGMQGILFLR